MRPLLIPLLALAMPLLAEPPGGAGSHLFILSGQSNMARLDVDAHFTPLVEARLGRDRVIVVKDAEGGQSIRRWYGQLRAGASPGRANGDLYARLLARVRRAAGREKLLSVTFVWMQGERDARAGLSDTYARALAGLLSQLEIDLGQSDIHVVIGRLSDHGLGGPAHRHWQRIRDIQVRFAESRPRGAWVNTDDLNSGRNREGKQVHNDLHMTPAGYRELGARFASSALGLLQAQGGHRSSVGPGNRGGAATMPAPPGDQPE